MPLHGEKKPLYLAKSIRDLNQLANTSTDHTNLRMLAKSSQMLLKNASESYLEGDQEKAYVLYMRFFNVVTCVKKSKEYNKDKIYYDMLIGDKNCKMAIEKAEELSEALNARYDELVAMETSKKLRPLSQTNDDDYENKLKMDRKKEEEQKSTIAMIDPLAPIGWLTVHKLYEWFTNDSLSILLVDVRSKEQFDSSHVISFKDVINASDVLPGMTAKNIEIKLTDSDHSCWRNRSNYDAIIICDLSTTNQTFHESTSPLAHLKSALVKWDLEVKYKNEPLFLMGGFKDWAETFPMYVNKPLPREEINNKQHNGDDMKAILDSIVYDFDLSYLTSPPAAIKYSPEIISSGLLVPNVDRSKKPKNEVQSEATKNGLPNALTNGNALSNVTHHQKNSNIFTSSMKSFPKEETPPSSSSGSITLNDKTHYKQQGVVNSDDSKLTMEYGMPDKLRREIEELEERKRSLESEITDMDRRKVAEKKKSSEVSDGLSEEKSKQAKELAILLREKRKVAQELSDMSKQRTRIVNGNIANESFTVNDKPRAGDGVAVSSTHDSLPLQKIVKPLFPINDRSSSPLSATNPIKATMPRQNNQPITGSSIAVSFNQPSAKPQEPPLKTPTRISRDPYPKMALHSTTLGDSPRSSPKRVTINLADDEVSPKSHSETLKSNLKRFHSFPNIANLSEEGDEEETLTSSVAISQLPESYRPQQIKTSPPHVQGFHVQPPKVDRSIKPINSNKSLLEAKVRNLQPVWGSIGLGLTGLRNLGNTCYMNSIVQCLSNCFVFCTYFKDNHHSKEINWSNKDGFRGEIAIEFATLIRSLWSGQYKAISPYDFRAVVSKLGSMFASSQHQDAQELLEFVMNGLNEDLNRVAIKPQLRPQDNSQFEDEVAAEKAWKDYLGVENSVVVDLFRGQYKSRVMCSSCETKSTVFEPFMSLTLQIPENQAKVSLSDCLLHFSNEEKMTGDSRWLCPKCKQKRESTKRIVVWRLPQILIVHLKRFHYQGIWRNKISTNISFPLTNLDMSRYLSGPRNCEGNRNTSYNLFAVCNHYGTLDGGHYTAYCKNAPSGNWYKFDDSEVSEIPASSIQSPAAYLLFYAKAGLWPC